MPTSLTSKLLQGTGVTVFASLAVFTVWTKHIHWEDVSPAKDPVFRSLFYLKYNPSSNPTLHDVAVRKIPIRFLKPELLQDAQNGGTKLVECYCAGVWGKLGYAIQRQYLKSKYQNKSNKSTELWARREQLESTYPEDTKISEHFRVLTKTTNQAAVATPTLPPSKPGATSVSTVQENPISQNITLRCGQSPLPSLADLASSDSLLSLTAILHLDEGFAEFRMQSVFWQGRPAIDKGSAEYKKPPMGELMAWLHRRYVELLLEGAVRNTMQ